MNQYTGFAYVYDTFMDNIPYDDWCEYLTGLLNEYGVEEGVIAELGCGTGSVCMRLAGCGYKAAGIDSSRDMLRVATQKLTPYFRKRIRYSLQDMRSFRLKKRVRAVVSICDSMNYMLNRNDFISVLTSVYDNLCPGGIFIFDLKTIYFYEKILGSSVIADNYRNSSFIWDNRYDTGRRINEYRLSIFVRERGNIYRRYCETHRQRAYSIDEVCSMIKLSGLRLLKIYNAFTCNPPDITSERLYFIVKKERV